jgi:Rrf2 family protein
MTNGFRRLKGGQEMKLTTRTRYGTRLMIDIAMHSEDGPVQIESVAARQDISVKYLEKLANTLNTAGFLKSRRGPRGGHMLARAPEKITLGEIVRVLEGRPLVMDCGGKELDCPRIGECLTRRAWEEVTQAVYEKLDSYTIADLMRGPTCG